MPVGNDRQCETDESLQEMLKAHLDSTAIVASRLPLSASLLSSLITD